MVSGDVSMLLGFIHYSVLKVEFLAQNMSDRDVSVTSHDWKTPVSGVVYTSHKVFWQFNETLTSRSVFVGSMFSVKTMSRHALSASAFSAAQFVPQRHSLPCNLVVFMLSFSCPTVFESQCLIQICCRTKCEEDYTVHAWCFYNDCI